MRKRFVVMGVLALLAVGVSSASATYWLSYQGYTGNAVGVVWKGSSLGTLAGGRYTVRVTGSTVTTYNGFFCIDLEHRMGTSPFDTNLHYIPPYEPENPPPYNTRYAAWVFQNDRTSWSTSSSWAAATQLTLCEVTHEEHWRDTWMDHQSDWWLTGDFKASPSSTVRGHSTTIINSLYAGGESPFISRSCSYYEPVDNDNPDGYGQGLLRDGQEIPEPTSLILVGTILLAGAGLSWSRRARLPRD